MSKYRNQPFVDAVTERVGVLMVNLGSPDAPTADSLRRYLAEFLWDPRVVEQPRALWWLILHGIILRTRPARSAHAYKAVWTEQGAPLLDISRKQAAAMQAELDRRFGGAVTLELAMRYGRPSVAQGLEALRARNAGRVLVLPMYPQYSASTTASSFDAVAQTLMGVRRLPELRTVNDYHDEPAYILALANSIREHWERNGRAERLLFSFHGLPKRYADAGDPYASQCAVTARRVAEALELGDNAWFMAFQSRFGREEWLRPYTDHTLTDWAKSGITSVDVVCPGFAADCLETLEEIAQQNRDLFLHSGGKAFHYIPALNDRREHIHFLVDLIARHLQGWPTGRV